MSERVIYVEFKQADLLLVVIIGAAVIVISIIGGVFVYIRVKR